MALAATLLLAAAAAAPPPLIPRELLFAPPEATAALLSPDGKQLGWLAADPAGVAQLWVRPLPGGTAVQVTQGSDRPVVEWDWTQTGAALLFTRDTGQGVHLFAVELAGRAPRDLTPWPGARAELLGTAARAPDHVLVLANARDPSLFDVHKVGWKTGSAELDTKNPGDLVGFAFDDALVVRAALARLPDGGFAVRVREGTRAPWRALLETTAHEKVALLGLALDGKGVYLATSVGADTTRVVEKNLKTGAERALAQAAGSDVREWLYTPWKATVQAAAFEKGGRLEWAPIEPSVAKDLELLAAFATPGTFRVVSRDRADLLWLVELDSGRAPKKTVLWDRAAKKAAPLFFAPRPLEDLPLAETRAVAVPARDGLVLPALLTLPTGAAPGPRPLVLAVRELPWAADGWGFEPRAQLFANRGYAVLQVNFRGSAGYGKRFSALGDREWGKRMQDDLTDAVGWAVREGVADPKRVAIFGQGWGGYAALAALARSPELYRCGVAGSAPVDLVALARSTPAQRPLRGEWARRVGDPTDRADKARLEQASVLPLEGRIAAPVLLAQGGLGPPAQREAVQALAARLEQTGRAVTLVQYPDEGQALLRPQNALDFFARTELFLAACLGGRAEPLPKGGRVAGSSAQVTARSARAGSVQQR